MTCRNRLKDGIARVEYVVPEFKGIKVRQKTIHAYLGAGDLCAEVHLSKAGFEPGDQSLFEEILSTAKLLPDRSPAGNQGQIAAPPPSELPSSTFAKAVNTIYSRTIRPQQPFIRRPSTSKNKNTLYPKTISASLSTTWGCHMAGGCSRRR
jgi:hypothetical protein